MTSPESPTSIQLPFGATRTSVAADHAMIGPDSHVPSEIPGWNEAMGVVLISPAMGSAPRAPRFCQYLLHTDDKTKLVVGPEGVQRVIYVLEGEIKLDGQTLKADAFAWLPPGEAPPFASSGEATLLVYEKSYASLPGIATPTTLIGNLASAPVEPFLGDDDLMLATLLPTDESFDMAVNVFTYQSGGRLPFVETHVMEHGLYMRSGEGIYRLAEKWYPVQQGDTIWMAAYCPQWFVAMGKGPASYIYHKDVNRHPLAP